MIEITDPITHTPITAAELIEEIELLQRRIIETASAEARRAFSDALSDRRGKLDQLTEAEC